MRLRPLRLRRLLLRPLAVLFLLFVSLPSFGSSASAEVSDVVASGQVGDPTPALSVPWLVSVWDFAEIDGVVYVGGQFTTIRRWAGDEWVSQPYLAAFDAVTGQPVPGFAPRLNGAVFTVEASTDGSRLFVGGEFTEVNGAARTGLVAVDPATGDTIDSFTTTVTGTQTPAVMDLETFGGQLYVAGSFTTIRNDLQGSVSRWRVARLYQGSGNADGFRPAALNGRVYDVEPSPDGTRVYLGGAFNVVNTDPTAKYFAAVSSSGAGNLLPGFSQGVDRTNLPSSNQPAYVFAIAATTDRVWLGMESHLLYMLDARTGERYKAYFSTWWDENNKGGDFQELLVVGDRLYSGGHAYGMMVDLHNDSRCIGKGFLACRDSFPQSAWIDLRGTWMQAFNANTGSFDPSFRPRTSGRSGVWALHWSASERTLWFGGDITHNNFDAAQGFGRLRDTAVVIQPDAVTVASTRQTRERIVLHWTSSLNPQALAHHFEIERDGRIIGTDEDLWFTDTGLPAGTTFGYRVRPVTADGTPGPWSPLLQATTLP